MRLFAVHMQGKDTRHHSLTELTLDHFHILEPHETIISMLTPAAIQMIDQRQSPTDHVQ